jgi:hypothetical protein
VGSSTTEGGATDLRLVEKEGVSFVGFSLPEHWSGRLTLLLGRPAKPGEVYKSPTDAYAEGEPLACSGTLGRPLRSARSHLGGYDVRVQQFDGASHLAGPGLPLAVALKQGLGKLRVTGALALSPSELEVDVGGPPLHKTRAATC